MAVYRFRVTFEDNEEVFREIEIKSSQNFEDFHNSILQSIGFDNQHNASFYISDDYWRKGDEITLKLLDREATEVRGRSNPVPQKEMRKCKIASVIDDPHQKFVYVYDLKNNWSFLVELLKIVPDDPKATYPKISKSVGEAPKQYKTTAAVVPLEEDEEFDDEPQSDDDAYVHAHSNEETSLLGSEEGEEELIEETETDEEQESSEFDAAAEPNEEDY